MLDFIVKELNPFTKLRTPWAVLLALLCFTLLCSFFLKKPCIDLPWGGTQRNEYRTLCYNDIEALYGVRKLNVRAFPYVTEKSYEYPVIIGLTMWTASLFANNFTQFFIATLPFLSAAALLTLLGLIGAIGSRPRVLFYALAPPLFLYAFHNWDLLAVAPLALAMWAWKEKKETLAGIGLGVGAAAKLFPGFFVPVLMVAALKSKEPQHSPESWKNVLLGAVGAYAAINLPIIVADWFLNNQVNGWLNVFLFHSHRLPDFGTIWYWLPDKFVGDNLSLAWRFVPALMIAATTGAAVLFTRIYIGREHERPVAILGGALTVFTGLVMSLPAMNNGSTSQEYKQLVDGFSFLIFACGTGALLVYQWRRNREPWPIAGAIIALFLIVAKVHSPQYALWLLPFFVILPTPVWLILSYYLTDLLLLVGNWFWVGYSDHMESNGWQTLYISCIFFRAALLALLIIWYVLKAPDLVSEQRRTELGKQLA